MDIKEVKYKITKTVPVYTNGEPIESQTTGWFIAHGHGQRADRIIQKWSGFDQEKNRVVSVEGSNRFYWAEDRKQFATTWMTSRFRLDDIEDNNNHFDRIYDTHLGSLKTKVIFGFSQGGTTLWRWIHDRRPDFEVFINYAGWIPEDIDLSILTDYLSGKKLIFVYGDHDEYLTSERIVALKEVVAKSLLNIEFVNYDGKHKVDRKVLSDIAKKYVR